MYFSMSHKNFKNLIFTYNYEDKFHYADKVIFAKRNGYKITKIYRAKNHSQAQEKALELLKNENPQKLSENEKKEGCMWLNLNIAEQVGEHVGI